LLAAPDLHITLEFDGEARRAHLAAHSPSGQDWLSSLRFP
jgi:hypothetical protein